MSLLFNIRNEVDLDWTSLVTGGGAIVQSAGSALAGTKGGMELQRPSASTTVQYAEKTFTAFTTQTDIRCRLYTAKNTYAMTDGDWHNFLEIYSSVGDARFQLALAFSTGDGFYLWAQARNDADTLLNCAALHALGATFGFSRLEVHGHKSLNGTGANDGFLKVYLDGVEATNLTITGIDLFDKFDLDMIRVGHAWVDATDGATGTLFVDEVVARDDDIPIGDGVQFVTTQNGEMPFPDSGTWTLTLTVTGDDGLVSDPVTRQITVVNAVPVITSDGGGPTATINAPEGQTAVTTVVATDTDAGDTLTASIIDGTDAAKFAIVGATGVLTFVDAPVFATPTDANADGVYDVTVQVSDGEDTVTQAISVTVTLVPKPVVGLTGNAVTITNGQIEARFADHTEFVGVTSGSSSDRVFTIQNDGDADLVLSGVPIIALSGDGAAAFSVIEMPVSPIAPSANDTFTIRFAPTSFTTYDAIVSIDHNDTDEHPFTFVILGEGLDSAPMDGLTGGGTGLSQTKLSHSVGAHT